MRFLTDNDFNVLIRNEITKIISETTDSPKMLLAEKMAIAQIRNHLAGRYDCDAIFTATADDRDAFIVMITIDIALYHLWSKEGGNNIPKLRELRYNDALKWLQDVQNGLNADLPELLNTEGDVISDVRIYSIHEPENYRY